MRKRHFGLSFAIAGGTACVAAFTPAIGQQATGAIPAGTGSGTKVTLDLDTALRVNDNLQLDVNSPGTTSVFENRLALGINSSNKIDQLRFNLTGVARYEDRPTTGTSAGFRDPSVSFGYNRDTGNATLAFSADYRTVDLAFYQPLIDTNLDGVIDQSDLIDDDGTREDTRLSAQLQTGVNDPLGFTFGVQHRSRNFDDAQDPNLYDWNSDSASVTARLRFNRLTQGRIQIGYTDYSAEDATTTQRQTTDLTAGITHQISSTTSLDASIGNSRIEETLNGAPTPNVRESLIGTVSLTRTLPNGTIGGSINRSFDTNGDRTSAQISRNMNLPAGSLGFSLGVSDDSTGDFTTIGSLNYVQNLPTGQFSANLSQRIATSTLNNEVRTAQADLRYSYTVNSVSSIAFNLSYVDTTEINTGTPVDRRRGSIGVSYNYRLTPDWDLSSGVRHDNRWETGVGSATSNSVFVNLNRSFTLKP